MARWSCVYEYMKQSTQLKLGQSQTMTPQLQQAIRLLQLSSVELSVAVQDALDSNMMLELDERTSLNDAYDSTVEVEDNQIFDDEADTDLVSVVTEETSTSNCWEEIYDGAISAGGMVARSNDQSEFEVLRTTDETLRGHLLWQLNLLSLTDIDRAIAFAIIDMLNENGYLESDLTVVCETVNGYDEIQIEVDEVAAVLKQVQGLDPAGIAARDLRECLLLQLEQLDLTVPWLKEAKQVCTQHLDVLASRDYGLVMRSLKLSQDELRLVLDLIQSLNPRPGAVFNEEPPEYVVPDVYVRKEKDYWKVELNSEALPQIRVNRYYASMIKRADNSADNNSLKSHLQEAKWFIKSIQSRSKTLLRVATAIVERQHEFLRDGDEAMRPLVLQDISQAVGMHESTVSRITTRKYMHTERGIYELKYFFSSHVATTYGSDASSTAIRAVMRKLISAENSEKPLSDSKIATLLSDQGVNVARRTVAKYREAMQIPPSSARRQL